MAIIGVGGRKYISWCGVINAQVGVGGVPAHRHGAGGVGLHRDYVSPVFREACQGGRFVRSRSFMGISVLSMLAINVTHATHTSVDAIGALEVFLRSPQQLCAVERSQTC
jgi:hypothetical protein